MRFSQDDADLVDAVLAKAGRGIVAVVAPRSDAYHDVGLHYAVLAMLLVPLWWMMAPQGMVDWFTGLLLGPGAEPTRYQLMLYLFAKLAATFLVVRFLLAWRPLRMALTPGRTKSRRVHRRAVETFRASCESKTRGRTGVLLYLSLDEKRAEIVADKAINDLVQPEAWGEATVVLIGEVKAGRPAPGMALAIEKIGAVLAPILPPTHDNPDELPNRVIAL